MSVDMPVSPPGWKMAMLGDLLINIQAGKSFKCDERPPVHDEVGVVKVSAVTWGFYDETESKTCTNDSLIDEDLFISPGDFLFSRANTIELVGACVIAEHVTKRVMLSDKILRFDISHNFDRWILWSLRSSWGRSEIERLATGNQESMRNIGQERIRQIRIALPPIRERDLIVESIDSYLSRLDSAVASLQKVQTKLKAYRASVLKAAVEGRLVPTEAEIARREGRDYEPASVLLARILKERRCRWEEAELARMKKAGKPPKDDAWKTKYQEPEAPDTSKLPPLPEGWCWARAEQVSLFITKGTTPTRSEMQPTNGSVPFIKVYNLRFDGSLDFTQDPTFISKEVHLGFLERSVCMPGDVLMNIVGPPLGKVAIVPSTFPEWNINQAIARYRPIAGITAYYLTYVLLGDQSLRWAESRAKATAGQFNLTLEIARDIPIPIPPEPEQQRIVDEIDRQLSASVAVLACATSSVIRCARLRQSVLKWAFEGKLVDQDPYDEPAEELLARIRAERAAAPTTKTRGRKAKSS